MLDTSNARAFNSSLKRAVTQITGQKVKVEIINSYKFPNCNVRIHSEKGLQFSNEFKLQVFDACGHDRKGLLDANNVSYGVIQSTWISAHTNQWCKLFN